MSPVALARRKRIDTPERTKVPSTKLNPGPEALTSIELPPDTAIVLQAPQFCRARAGLLACFVRADARTRTGDPFITSEPWLPRPVSVALRFPLHPPGFLHRRQAAPLGRSRWLLLPP